MYVTSMVWILFLNLFTNCLSRNSHQYVWEFVSSNTLVMLHINVRLLLILVLMFLCFHFRVLKHIKIFWRNKYQWWKNYLMVLVKIWNAQKVSWTSHFFYLMMKFVNFIFCTFSYIFEHKRQTSASVNIS